MLFALAENVSCLASLKIHRATVRFERVFSHTRSPGACAIWTFVILALASAVPACAYRRCAARAPAHPRFHGRWAGDVRRAVGPLVALAAIAVSLLFWRAPRASNCLVVQWDSALARPCSWRVAGSTIGLEETPYSAGRTVEFMQTRMFAESAPYERFMGRWSRHLAPQLVKFVDICSGDSVSTGSGTGALSFAIVDALPPLTSRHRSRRAYVADANARASHAARFAAWWRPSADAVCQSRIRSGRVSSRPELHSLPLEALHERGGHAARRDIGAAVWDYGGGCRCSHFWDEAVRRDSSVGPRDERHMPLCKQGELSALWRAHRLAQVDEQPLSIQLSFASFDDYWSPFTGGQGPVGWYVARLSNADREALQCRLRNRLLGDGPDRAFTLEARAWAVKGIVP